MSVSLNPLKFCGTSLTCVAASIISANAAITHLDGLNSLATGVHSVTAGGNTFDGYVRNDGGTGWLLIGRGREGWEFDNDGQGGAGANASSVLNGSDLGTISAFSPAMYADAVINELISNSAGGVDYTGAEVRFRRAGDSTGTDPFQEVRWRATSQTTWRGDFDFSNPGYALTQDVLSGIGGPVLGTAGNSRDTIAAGNNFARIFTWSWTGHSSVQGFSFGNVTTNGDSSATNFWWESANENHAIPYTEVYIRLLNPVPEPSATALAALGMLGLVLRRRR